MSIDSAWRCASGAVPRFVDPAPAHRRGELESEEVRERGDQPRPLELIERADDTVGYQERAIVICALYDAREDDAGELDDRTAA